MAARKKPTRSGAKKVARGTPKAVRGAPKVARRGTKARARATPSKRPARFRVEPREFMVRGDTLRADLYLPSGTSRRRPPILVMAHGFGAARDFGLPPFAEYFAARGMAVLLFDYRTFGRSDGEPRSQVHPRRHNEDWDAAIRFAQTLPEVDSARMGLWGTSFSGGHVLVQASRHPGVRAVSALVPHVDGLTVIRHLGLAFCTRAALHGIWDLIRSALGLRQHWVPVIPREPGQFGLLATAESIRDYPRLVPPGSEWPNRSYARTALLALLYRPINRAMQIRAAVLLIAGRNDSLIALRSVEKMDTLIANSTLLRFPVGHFDCYFGEWFERTAEVQAEFLRKELG